MGLAVHIFTIYIDRTLIALRFPCITALPSVKDQTMVRPGPSGLRNPLHQGKLRFQNVFFCRQSNPVCYPKNMSIHSDPLFSEAHRKNHIGGLSTNTGQAEQFFVSIRYLTTEIFHKHLRHTDNVL